MPEQLHLNMDSNCMSLEDIPSLELPEVSECRKKLNVKLSMCQEKHEFIGNKVTDIKVLLQPIISLGKYCAVLKPENFSSERKIRKAGIIVYFLSVQLFLWAMSAKYVLILLGAKELGEVLPMLAICSFNILCSSISLSSYIKFSKPYDNFVAAFNKHNMIYGEIPITPLLLRIIKWFCVYLIVMGLMTSLYYNYFLFNGGDVFDQLLYPFNFRGIQNTVLTLTINFIHILFLFLHTQTNVALADSFFILILLKFHYLNKDLESVIQMHVNNEIRDLDFQKIIESLRQRHLSIAYLLRSADSLLSYFLFCIFAASVPITSFILYGLVRNLLGYSVIGFISGLAVFYLAFNSYYLLLGAILTAKAHAPLDILMKVNVENVTEKAYESVLLFVHFVKGKAIGFTVSGLFTLDSTAILMILGTFVTYAVVMLQFTGVSSSEGTSLSNNNTCD